MTLEKIKEGFHNAVVNFSKSNYYLIEHNLNERTITHKLAEHLQLAFPEFHVDCEYNREVDNEIASGRLISLKERYEEAKGKLITIKGVDISVYPDIIIHERGTNNRNLLVIEIKKTTNTDMEARKFDKDKLKCFTAQSNENTLQYKYGLFILLETNHGKNSPDKIIVEEEWFETKKAEKEIVAGI